MHQVHGQFLQSVLFMFMQMMVFVLRSKKKHKRWFWTKRNTRIWNGWLHHTWRRCNRERDQYCIHYEYFKTNSVLVRQKFCKWLFCCWWWFCDMKPYRKMENISKILSYNWRINYNDQTKLQCSQMRFKLTSTFIHCVLCTKTDFPFIWDKL